MENSDETATETKEELLPLTVRSPEGVSYRLFFDAEQKRAYVDPPATPGPGGLPVIVDVFSTSAETIAEATSLLTAWAHGQGWEVE